MSEYRVILHIIGGKSDLCLRTVRRSAREYAQALMLSPGSGPHMISLDGFDDDARELWDIPEARAYLALFWDALKWEVPGTDVNRFHLEPESLGMIAVCAGFGQITWRDPGTGAYKIMITSPGAG